MTNHHPLFTALALFLLAPVSLVACASDSSGTGETPAELDSSCAMQKPELAATYCQAGQDLWACSDGEPEGQCAPASASSNSFCCGEAIECVPTARQLKAKLAETCPRLGMGSDLVGYAQASCSEDFETFLTCLLGCTDKPDCEKVADCQSSCYQKP